MKAVCDTKTAILDTAQDLIQRKSMSGVSFQELADLVGIKKGSMYYHFETKEKLTIAILKRAGDDLKGSYKRGIGKTATQQLDYFFNIYSKFIRVGERLCPGGTLASEWGKISNPIKEQVQRLIKIQGDGIRDIVEAGVKSGEFKTNDLSVNELTLWIVSCIQGSLLTGRIMESSDSFESCIKTIRTFLYEQK